MPTMANELYSDGEVIPRGLKVTTANQTKAYKQGWRLVTTHGKQRYFLASLIEVVSVGGEQVLIFKMKKTQNKPKR